MGDVLVYLLFLILIKDVTVSYSVNLLYLKKGYDFAY